MMSLSLRIENGDLAVEGRAFKSVTGVEKLQQDLRLWVLERIGTDPATPNYGSRLDGGTIDGLAIPTYIGKTATDERVSEIRAEVMNQLTMYQSDQLQKIRAEALRFGTSTITADEVLSSIESIEAKAIGTTIVVRVTITTLSSVQLKLIIPVEF